MNAAAADTTSLVVASILIFSLVALRVFVFRWCAQARGHSFIVSHSLRKLLQALGSFAIPGLGQALQCRFEVATCHLLVFGAAWHFAGWYAIPVHILSALECARN